MRRRTLAIVIAALVFALSAAAAASLGGISATSLGADATAITSCDDNGITVEFTTSFVGGAYEVTEVILGGIADACDGLGVEVTLYDDSDISKGVGTDTYDKDAHAGTITIPMASGIKAAEVFGVAVIIAG